jgi:hypothetical protein
MADNKFDVLFSSNEFGYACSVCDRLWFASDVSPVIPTHFVMMQSYFRDEDVQLYISYLYISSDTIYTPML